MSIDWKKPLELMDGTPVRLAAGENGSRFNNAVDGGPDLDGDYWIEREDGEEIIGTHNARYAELCVHANGNEEGTQTVIVRNRGEEHRRFTVDTTAYMRNLAPKQLRGDWVAVHYQAPPTKSEDGKTTGISMRFPFLILVDYVEDAGGEAAKIAAILNEHYKD